MTIENWMQLLVPVVSIAMPVISAALAYFFAKKKQILAGERRLKEKYCLNYIEAASNMAVFGQNDETTSALATAQNRLLLVGSSPVVKDLLRFYECITSRNNNESNQKEQNKLLTNLLKSMRTDLHIANKGYPEVYLITPSKRGGYPHEQHGESERIAESHR
jgi:hypothetical protein